MTKEVLLSKFCELDQLIDKLDQLETKIEKNIKEIEKYKKYEHYLSDSFIFSFRIDYMDKNEFSKTKFNWVNNTNEKDNWLSDFCDEDTIKTIELSVKKSIKKKIALLEEEQSLLLSKFENFTSGRNYTDD